MRKTISCCDCCGKESETILTCRLPITCFNDDDLCLISHDIDLCEQCANDISRAYYNLSRKYNKSGIIVIAEEVEE